MILKHTTLTAIGLIVSIGALYWVDPLTTAGQTVLVALVTAVIYLAGAVLWRS